MDSDSSSSGDEEVVLAVLLTPSSNAQQLSRFNFGLPSTDPAWKAKFRFEKEELLVLVDLLKLPNPFPTRQRYLVSAFEALCIFLRRMAYPARLSDLQDLFGRNETAISSISNAVLDHLYSTFHHLFQFDHARLTEATLSTYASAIHSQGAPLHTCVGFIDGTVRGTCRPLRHQKYVFNGHKRKHALKYQSVLAPDGIIVHLSGPFPGTRHDAYILQQSGLLEAASPSLSANGRHFVFYGDPAYGRQAHIVAPFKGATLSRDEQVFKRRMSEVRVSVEWGFGKIVRYWAFVDFPKNQKLYLQRLGKMYTMGAFLANVHTCFYGSQTSSFFELTPPRIEEYLNNL
ncbi:hypothetical protein F443_05166 [Phytophthora nicotianae P1569]|uniref:DDE Tnp4 domain-containing protein n=1 Tax=Phytophthora nicotianae P1569 TaxID=1317065 RepID=V9FL22_PHYNI|nr:hypothetical protein F443_05166 [Phytophthora nicotianae P1569]